MNHKKDSFWVLNQTVKDLAKSVRKQHSTFMKSINSEKYTMIKETVKLDPQDIAALQRNVRATMGAMAFVREELSRIELYLDGIEDKLNDLVEE